VRLLRPLTHLVIAVILTALTQLGGIAWLVSRLTRRPLPAFAGLYLSLTLLATWIAPLTGRVPLSCSADGPLRVQSWLYCALNRNYVTPDMAALAGDLAAAMAAEHPGSLTLALDGSFPFTGLPLLPHLSHDDGEKLDLAFYYRDAQGEYQPGLTRSPLGYFAFELGSESCPARWPTLRWDLAWLQPLWPAYQPDAPRMSSLLTLLATDSRVSKVFLEPHLVQSLGVTSPKFRFQGCRAARHDDHIHIEL